MRDAFREPVSLDTRPTVEREWLAMQVSKLATEILSPDALKDLESHCASRNRAGRHAPDRPQETLARNQVAGGGAAARLTNN